MITRYRFPLAPFNDLRQEVEGLLGGLGAGRFPTPFRETAAFPLLDIRESDEALHVEAELPGVSQDDLEIVTLGAELTIKGRCRPRTGDENTYYRQERPFGEFCRVITLPADVDSEKVEATLKDGVLMLTLPKLASARSRRIPVKSV